MATSMAVFGSGRGLGQAVARRYGREGYDVVLIARRREPLDEFAQGLRADGITAHAVTADLSETGSVPTLAEEIRERVGNPTAFYYGPAAGGPGFVPAATLAPEQVQDLMPRTLYTLLALVQQFLPAMLDRGDGAILSAQGVSALQGWAQMSGWPPALAAQRNYLQSLAAEVEEQGVYVGMLYVGARIVGSAADAEFQEALSAGKSVPDMYAADSAELADLIWRMHSITKQREAVFPEDIIAPESVEFQSVRNPISATAHER